MEVITMLNKTELEAVNGMLLLIGESPVQSLTNTDFQPAGIAKQLLTDTHRMLIGKGWNFNTNLKDKLYPDPHKNIYIPSKALKCIPSMYDQGIVVRGDRLYNLNENTYEFDDDYIECDITYAFDFEECPLQFQQYVEIVAGRKFENRMLKTGSMYQLTEKEERDAKVAFLQFDTDLVNPNITDSYRVGAVSNRLRNPIPYWRL
jgi:hypothetical protein